MYVGVRCCVCFSVGCLECVRLEKGGLGAGVGAQGSGLRGGVCVVGVCCFCGLTKID